MVARWEGVWGMGEEVRTLRSTNWQLENSHGDVKYSIGNGVAKELICTTHGNEQWCGDCLRELGMMGGRGKWGKIGTTIAAKSIKYNLKKQISKTTTNQKIQQSKLSTKWKDGVGGEMQTTVIEQQ